MDWDLQESLKKYISMFISTFFILQKCSIAYHAQVIGRCRQATIAKFASIPPVADQLGDGLIPPKRGGEPPPVMEPLRPI